MKSMRLTVDTNVLLDLAALLLSSDQHLRNIDHERLMLVLSAFGLVPPVIASPLELVSKFFR
jgi:hypothetical protein